MKLLFLLLTFFIVANAHSKDLNIKNGKWLFSLHISDTKKIKINAVIKKDILTITNGVEKINLKGFINDGDSLVANFSLYNSCIVIKNIGSKKLEGYWRNYQRKGNYKIPFTARKKAPKFQGNPQTLSRLEGVWEATIQYKYPTKLIGVFKGRKNSLSGTFRSETGDYRYLFGNASKDSMYLSCFDGTHCYLFTAKLFNGDSLSGHFYSGNHYKTHWTAVKNPGATLSHPDSLTFLTNENKIEFSLPSTNNEILNFSSSNLSRPTILQLFGTWCPNCVDETNLLNEVYSGYEEKVDIIGIGFEMGSNDKIKMRNLINFKKQMHVTYPILLGGDAKKEIAAELFPMLNHVMSFPTMIVIDQSGKVVKVHTGFNGPATGSHYIDFKKDLTDLLSDLVQ